MKLALIAGSIPASNMANQYMNSYKFLLPQKIGRMQEDAPRVMVNYRRRGYFVMLDNGAPEGQLQDNVKLMEAYDLVQPDELVLPDILEGIEATMKATTAFINEYGDRVPPRKRMVVPQGETFEEWEKCLDWMVQEVDFATIGVPKHMEEKEGGRVACLQAIERKELHLYKHVHMLGCFQDPVKEVRHAIAACPWIRGIDTAAPFAYAQDDLDIQVGYHVSYEWGGAFDEESASYNIDKLLKACAGG